MTIIPPFILMKHTVIINLNFINRIQYDNHYYPWNAHIHHSVHFKTSPAAFVASLSAVFHVNSSNCGESKLPTFIWNLYVAFGQMNIQMTVPAKVNNRMDSTKSKILWCFFSLTKLQDIFLECHFIAHNIISTVMVFFCYYTVIGIIWMFSKFMDWIYT